MPMKENLRLPSRGSGLEAPLCGKRGPPFARLWHREADRRPLPRAAAGTGPCREGTYRGSGHTGGPLSSTGQVRPCFLPQGQVTEKLGLQLPARGFPRSMRLNPSFLWPEEREAQSWRGLLGLVMGHSGEGWRGCRGALEAGLWAEPDHMGAPGAPINGHEEATCSDTARVSFIITEGPRGTER